MHNTYPYIKDIPISDPGCIVDGVIYSLRSNGFLVYVPAYALKGPVYLENKSREVVYSGPMGLLWQKGVITQREHFVKVETLEGTDVYRIFDHVTVGIQLKGSEAHGHELSFILLDKQGFVSRKDEQPAAASSFNFLSAAREAASLDESDEEQVTSEETDSKAYAFFQNMRSMGTMLPEQQ